MGVLSRIKHVVLSAFLSKFFGLTAQPFSADIIAEVRDFDCGHAEWEEPLSEWIKCNPGGCWKQ